MSENSREKSMSILVFTHRRMPRGEKRPLLRELRRIDPELDYEQAYGGGGPLPPDVVLPFVEIAVKWYLAGFFAAAAAAHYKALHRRIARLTTKITREEEKALEGVDEEGLSEVEGELPRTAPLEISAGRVHFYFQGEITPEQVAERLHKAREVVDSLPEEDLRLEGREAYEAGGPRNFIWDEDAKSWIEKGPRYDPNLSP